MLSKATRSKIASSKAEPTLNPHGLQPTMSIPTPKGFGGEKYNLASLADPTTLKLMLFDMRDYCDDCSRLYTKVTGCGKFKHARTPFLPDSSCPPGDDEVAGELKPNACKCLMKCLWLGRLARPDIMKAVNDLTTFVQKWSKNHDRKLYRIFCCSFQSIISLKDLMVLKCRIR